MTPDQAVTQVREGLLAGEAWLREAGDTANLKTVQRAHAMLEKVAKTYKARGVLLRSGGEGKDP